MKNILVLLHDDKGQEARLQVALDVTRALEGHLLGLDLIVPTAVATGFIGVIDSMVLQCAVDQEADNRTRLHERLEKEDVPFSIIDEMGSPGGKLRKMSDFADLIVVTSHSDEADPLDTLHIVSEVATKTHQPVLAVPPGCKGVNLAGKVLVAWNRSHQSSEALKAAMPLLQKASSVTLLDLNAAGGDFETADAASYLSRHGVHAEVIVREADNQVSDAILAKAADMDAAYIVMGAYGAGFTLEAVFGGVTPAMLRKSDRPLLLAH